MTKNRSGGNPGKSSAKKAKGAQKSYAKRSALSRALKKASDEYRRKHWRG